MFLPSGFQRSALLLLSATLLISAAVRADCPTPSAALPAGGQAEALVGDLEPVLDRLNSSPCGIAVPPEKIAQHSLALQAEIERIEREEKTAEAREKRLGDWLSKNVDASTTSLLAARIDIAKQVADHDRMMADHAALESDPKLKVAYENYDKAQRTVLHMATLAAIGRMDRSNDSAETKSARAEAIRFLSQKDVGAIAYRAEPVYRPSNGMNPYGFPQNEQVPYFKESNSAELHSDELISRNLKLVEATTAFQKEARGKISPEAIDRFHEQQKTIVREAISLGSDLTETEFQQRNRNLAAGYLAFEAATWLIPVGRIGKVVGAKAGSAIAGGAHSVSVMKSIKTLWNSGKALKTLTKAEKLRRMGQLSGAGFYTGAAFGGAYAVADKAIDSMGREEDFLCALAHRYQRDGNSAKAALVSGLIGAGGGGVASLAPRIGLLLGAGGIAHGGLQTDQNLMLAKQLYRSGDSAGAVRELARAGLVGGTTLAGVRSGLQSLRSSMPGAAPPARALGEKPGISLRPGVPENAPPLSRRIAREATPARKGVLDREWVGIDEVVKTHPDLLQRAFANPQFQKLRAGSSGTVLKSPIAQDSWKRADAMMQDWVKTGERITLEKIRLLNQTLRESPSQLPPEKFDYRKGGWSNYVATRQPVRHKPVGMDPETYNSMPETRTGRKILIRDYVPPKEVATHMEDFQAWLTQAEKQVSAGRAHPIDVAAEAYQRLVSIHPFSDGNGRTTRLVMEWILIKNGYPPPVLEGTRKNVAIFEDDLVDGRNLSPGAAQVKITQGIREAIKVLKESSAGAAPDLAGGR